MNEAFYSSVTWFRIRQKRLDFAGHRCELCNTRADLQVHHSTYARFGGNERIQDLIVLCKACHEAFHQHKTAMQIAQRWIRSAFLAGVLVAIRQKPNEALEYALFRTRWRIVLRPIDLEKDGFQDRMNRLADRVAKWIQEGMPGLRDFETHKSELAKAKEEKDRTWRAVRRRTITEIWFQEFEPRLAAVMDSLRKSQYE